MSERAKIKMIIIDEVEINTSLNAIDIANLEKENKELKKYFHNEIEIRNRTIEKLKNAIERKQKEIERVNLKIEQKIKELEKQAKIEDGIGLRYSEKGKIYAQSNVLRYILKEILKEKNNE